MLCLCQAALPPGYEDEVYCPPDYCLRKKAKPLVGKWKAGPRKLYVECFADDGRENAITDIKTWGYKLPKVEKDKLVEGGWHQMNCQDKAKEEREEL
jgi:hypothetical protein